VVSSTAVSPHIEFIRNNQNLIHQHGKETPLFKNVQSSSLSPKMEISNGPNEGYVGKVASPPFSKLVEGFKNWLSNVKLKALPLAEANPKAQGLLTETVNPKAQGVADTAVGNTDIAVDSVGGINQIKILNALTSLDDKKVLVSPPTKPQYKFDQTLFDKKLFFQEGTESPTYSSEVQSINSPSPKYRPIRALSKFIANSKNQVNNVPKVNVPGLTEKETKYETLPPVLSGNQTFDLYVPQTKGTQTNMTHFQLPGRDGRKNRMRCKIKKNV